MTVLYNLTDSEGNLVKRDSAYNISEFLGYKKPSYVYNASEFGFRLRRKYYIEKDREHIRCSRCNRDLHVIDIYFNKSKGKSSHWCYECINIYNRERWRNNHAKVD